MEIKIKYLHPQAIAPKRMTDGSAGYDLFALMPQYIPSNARCVVPLEFAIELPKGYVADIRPRSGYSVKGFAGSDGVRHNCDVLLGTIDSDYRGGINVILHNQGESFFIGRGQRIAQLVIHKCEQCEFVKVDDLEQTERGDGGFGHSGN